MAKKKKAPYPPSQHVKTFELKPPRWTRYVCLGAGGIGLIGTLVFLSLKSSGDINQDTFQFIYLFILFLLAGIAGTYAAFYEKFVLQDGVYTYFKPFLKNQSAKVEDIAYVELITKTWLGRYGQTEESYRVIFYGLDGNILIKFMDDGTFFHDENLVKSLRTYQIKTKRIQIEK